MWTPGKTPATTASTPAGGPRRGHLREDHAVDTPVLLTRPRAAAPPCSLLNRDTADFDSRRREKYGPARGVPLLSFSSSSSSASFPPPVPPSSSRRWAGRKRSRSGSRQRDKGRTCEHIRATRRICYTCPLCRFVSCSAQFLIADSYILVVTHSHFT